MNRNRLINRIRKHGLRAKIPYYKADIIARAIVYEVSLDGGSDVKLLVEAGYCPSCLKHGWLLEWDNFPNSDGICLSCGEEYFIIE